MKLYGLLAVQDEEDVIEDLLEFLRSLNIYEAIFFYDLGSEDNTFKKALKYKDILYEPQIMNEVWTEKLRFDLLKQHQNLYREGDWLSIIDADEFYVDNPRALIDVAEHENATCIKTYQIGFMFTDIDLQGYENEDLTLSILERRKYYLIDWSEIRFFKFLPGDECISTSHPCSKGLLNRHYRYRTPTQMQTRINIRSENKQKTRNLAGRCDWAQIYSHNWKDYIIPHKLLHKYDGDKFEFGIPRGVRWRDYHRPFSLFPPAKNNVAAPIGLFLPQIATILMNDQTRLEVANLAERDSSGVEGPNKVDSKKVYFQDYCANQLYSEALNDLRNLKWKESFKSTYVFLLYYITLLGRQSYGQLAKIIFRSINLLRNGCLSFKRTVLGKSTGWITATPNPIMLSLWRLSGDTVLSWSSTGMETLEVRVNAPDGPLFSRSDSSGTGNTGMWVQDGMVFYLQDVSGGLPLTAENTISTLTVRVISRGFTSMSETHI